MSPSPEERLEELSIAGMNEYRDQNQQFQAELGLQRRGSLRAGEEEWDQIILEAASAQGGALWRAQAGPEEAHGAA